MTETMERTRMIFDTEERYRRAVKLYAARHGLSVSAVFARALDALCDKELEEADEILVREERQAKRKTRDEGQE